MAVVATDGRLVARLGDPGLPTYLRSAAKPFQAIPLVAADGVARFSLAAADLALICASHGGTPDHVERVRGLLAKGGFEVADLACGAHWPFDAAAARALREAGEEPSALHNNCSGKHAGMLLACRALELDPVGYAAPDHPLQRRILAELAACCDVAESAVGVGIDGCSAPTFHLPLDRAALGYARLAAPQAGPLRAEVAEEIVAAMTGAPEMVAGPGRFTTRLMQATGGRILGKEGAEGFYAMAVRRPVALGIAVKVADGGERCRDGVVLEILRQAGVLSAAELADLEDLRRPQLRNHRGLEVGEIVPDLELLEG